MKLSSQSGFVDIINLMKKDERLSKGVEHVDRRQKIALRSGSALAVVMAGVMLFNAQNRNSQDQTYTPGEHQGSGYQSQETEAQTVDESRSVVISADCEKPLSAPDALTVNAVTVPSLSPLTPHIALQKTETYKLIFDHYQTPLEGFAGIQRDNEGEVTQDAKGENIETGGLAGQFYREACATEDIPKVQLQVKDKNIARFHEDGQMTGDPLRADLNKMDEGDMQGSIKITIDTGASEQDNFLNNTVGSGPLSDRAMGEPGFLHQPPDPSSPSSELITINLNKSGTPEFALDNKGVEATSYKVSLIRDLHVLFNGTETEKKDRFRANLEYAKNKSFPSNKWNYTSDLQTKLEQKGVKFR